MTFDATMYLTNVISKHGSRCGN